MKISPVFYGAVLWLLSACATATPYQPASGPGAYDGFSHTLIENNRARISFGGNSLTDRETVENYLLYRSAELTLEREFDYFVLLERDVKEKKRLQTRPYYRGPYDSYFGYSFYRPYYGWSDYYRYSLFGGFHYTPYGRRGFRHSGFRGYYHDAFFTDYDVREITKYRASAEVVFMKGEKPTDQDNTFDAHDVIENLGPYIVYPEKQVDKS